MDGQTIITVVATAVLIYAMWYYNKITKKDEDKKHSH
jgi:hypothetical protein